MEQQIENAIQWIKDLHTEEYNVRGCITGSCLLGYFPDSNQDVDVFLYDDNSFRNIYYAMFFNPMFQLLDPLEKWKFEQEINDVKDFKKRGLITIKFTYNNSVPVNIILKKDCVNIYSVISTFDMNIIAKGYDLATKQPLDLSGAEPGNKIVTWNRWNTSFDNPKLWRIDRILRQLDRVFKYHRRGYNTDAMVYKYIEIIDWLQKYQNIFDSEVFTERLRVTKLNTRIIKKVCLEWLSTHEITIEAQDLIKQKIKEI